MEIHFHAHHAEVSDAMRKRAERDVLKAAERIPRVVEAIIRFEQDGALRRVTLAFRAPKHHDLIGTAEGRYFGPAVRAGSAARRSCSSRRAGR